MSLVIIAKEAYPIPFRTRKSSPSAPMVLFKIFMTGKDKKISKNIIFFLFSIFFLIGLLTFRDYGMWGDETFQRFSGFYWLNYVLSFTSFD